MSPQEIVDQWNEQHPVGTLVKITNGAGIVTEAPTSAPAMLMTKTTPVVWLQGVHNYVLLARVAVVYLTTETQQNENELTDHGINYVAVDGLSCDLCCFDTFECSPIDSPPCSSSRRNDGREIIWKRKDHIS